MRLPVPSLPRYLRHGSGAIGLALLLLIVGIAAVGPLFAPHSIATPIGVPFAPPSRHALLGTDFLGRDVLSRILGGGRSVILLATAATVAAYLLGALTGLVSGFSRSLLDPLLMRSVDVMLSFPSLLVLLVLVTGAGPGIPVLILGVALVQMPGIARLIRTATLEVSTRSYVEASIARGERTPAILWHDILPNILSVVMSDFGIRYGYSVILIASMNFLNLGLQPPSADWGLMISQSRTYIGISPWPVVVPAILLAALTVGVNLVGDAYVRSRGIGTPATRRRIVATPASGPDRAVDTSVQV